MRIVIGFLSGVLGMLAGWFGLAMLVVAVSGHDRDGGIAMGAFFQIGPIGGLIGFAAGVWLFVKLGVVRAPATVALTSSPTGESPAVPPAPKTRMSRPFAILVVAIVGGLAWWGWWELIRSPYLTHGYMTLALQFRLPADMTPPAEGKDVKILLDEGGNTWPGYLVETHWLGHQGDRAVILASVTMSYKASERTVTLSMPGAPEQSWTLDLAYDPDPTPGYTPWVASGGSPNAIEMNYRLTADQ